MELSVDVLVIVELESLVNSIDDRMFIWVRLLCRCFISVWENFISCMVMLFLFIILLVSMKNGIVIRGNEFILL